VLVRHNLAEMHDLSCLVVDDNDSARQAFSNILGSFGWTVDTVDRGQAALDRLGGRRYDVIFVDWRMPGMDGWETSERIRQLLPADQATLIIMVTAYSREMLSERQALAPNLLDGFVIKPVTASMLYDAVADSRLAQLPTPPAMHAKPAAQRRLAGLSILLVEDNLINQQVARELLSNEGAQVAVASGGREAIAAVSDTRACYDLVLMDVQMPDMDGYEATRELRRKFPPHDLPIIAMTANAMPSDREAALAVGMNDHIGKPFDMNQLAALILHYARPMADGAEPAAIQTGAKPAKAAKALAVLNAPAAIRRMMDNADIYQRALQTFPEELDRFKPALAALVAAQDAVAAGKLLHAMKGVAGTVGAECLADRLLSLEQELKTDPAAMLHWQLDSLWLLTEQANTAALDWLGTLPATPTGGQPQGLTQQGLQDLLAGMQTLQQYLQASDLQADDVFAQLRQAYSAALPDDFGRLASSIEQLDFATAAQQCSELAQRVRGMLDERATSGTTNP
jgi:CheY-like chemotaxis protein